MSGLQSAKQLENGRHFACSRPLRAQRSWHGLTGESPVGVITREPRSISLASGVILASKRDVKVSERRLQAYRS